MRQNQNFLRKHCILHDEPRYQNTCSFRYMISTNANHMRGSENLFEDRVFEGQWDNSVGKFHSKLVLFDTECKSICI